MHLNKKIVLFDIDYTLFDVGHFDKNFHPYLAQLFSLDEKLVNEESIKTIIALIREEHFLDIDKYLSILLSKFKKEKYKEEIEKFLFGGDFFKNGFYPDVEITLRTLKDFVRLGIFSQGDEKLQGAKIEQSGFGHFFEKELIYLIKPKKLDFLPSLKKMHSWNKIYLVEDKLTILYEVKKQMPSVFGIWIKRGWYAENQKEIPGFKPDATITNLREIVKIVQ